MSMINEVTCIIIDDEPKSLANLEKTISSIQEIRLLGSFTNPFEALSKTTQCRPDMILTDIEMPKKSGFDFVKDVLSSGLDPFIVFTTAFDKYAINAIKTKAYDYLLKPIERDDLLQLISKVVADKEKDSNDLSKKVKKLKFSTLNGFFVLDQCDIVYIEADGNYSDIYLSDGQRKIVTLKLIDIQRLELLPSFLRVGRSFIINLSYLGAVDRKKGECHLKSRTNEYTLPINRKGIKLLSSLYDN